MNKNKNFGFASTSRRQGGFTLIELLVVIAIIGILSSVVLASLATARNKGADAKVKAQLASARSSAQMFLETNGSYNGAYGDVASDCAVDPDTMFQDSNSAMVQYTNPDNYPVGTTLRCSSTGNAYMISASLNNDTDFWCVDSEGNSKQITGADHATAHPDGDTLCD